MKVLHIAESVKGGVATYLNIIAPAQLKQFGVEGIAVCAPQQHHDDLFLPSEVRLLGFNASNFRIYNALKVALAAYRAVRASQFDVVHIHSTYAGFFARPLLKLLTNVKVVYCPHGWAWDRYKNVNKRRLVQGIERVLSHCTDKIVCISNHELHSAREAGLPASKLEKISNAVPVVSPAPEPIKFDWKADTVKILYVGRFDRQKGVDLFLTAMRLLGNGYSALMVGEAVVDQSFSINEIPENITMTGWLKAGQLETLYRKADFIVVPSRWEGFGLVAVEAMRAGCIVIATNVGGLTDIVAHRSSGLLIEPESPEAIAAAVKSLSLNEVGPMKAQAISRAATLFSADVLNERLIAMYGTLCFAH